MQTLVKEIAQVDDQQAKNITNFINCWLDLDWSNASRKSIKSAIKTAQEMMALPQFADMVKISERA
jgi:hypothetical protein